MGVTLSGGKICTTQFLSLVVDKEHRLQTNEQQLKLLGAGFTIILGHLGCYCCVDHRADLFA